MLKSFRQMSFCNRNMFVSFGEKMQTLRLVFFCIKIIDLRSFEGKLCIGNSFSSNMSAIHVISRMSRSMLTARKHKQDDIPFVRPFWYSISNINSCTLPQNCNKLFL